MFKRKINSASAPIQKRSDIQSLTASYSGGNILIRAAFTAETKKMTESGPTDPAEWCKCIGFTKHGV